jgi:uncharacterized Fe-S cluster-containing radical SAM superfamily protein
MLSLTMPFDPVQRSEQTELVVMNEGERRYSKFRAAPYYGGIATADAVGCSFLCAYCWNYGRNEDPARFGKFFSPENVANKLLEIARRQSFSLYRVTGSEPILGEASFQHLVKVIEIILSVDLRSSFILETNGLILGYQEELIQKLRSARLMVRVAIKGVNQSSFEKITGARRDFFRYPFLALTNLERNGVRAWPALMEDLFTEDEVNELRQTLRSYKIHSDLELERLEGYPFVLENMKQRGFLRQDDR